MAVGLVDTNVLIDALREHGPAISWLAQQGQLGVTRVVYLELIEGASNRIELQRALNFLKQFEPVQMVEADFEWATRQLVQFRLSHGVGMMDCLIAAPAHRHQLPLYSRNLKHLTPLLGSLAQKPY